jgi:sensor histidine kinase YesM
LLAYHFPTAIFPDWNIQARQDFATKKYGVDYVTLRGGWLKMLWEIIYRQAGILACYIAFTYSVIYYILPRYIDNKKNWIITTTILLLLLVAFLSMDYYVTFLTMVDTSNSMVKQGIPSVKMNTGLIISRTIVPAAFNLATLIGLTVTIKLMKRWWEKQKETEEVSKGKIIAELQLLKAQVHPHFLFNSLNNIYSFALEASPKAPEMILKLSDLLHYMLYDCKQPLVPLEKELKMIRDYISLEQIRYGERLSLRVSVSEINSTNNPEAEQILITPLLLIPFVENSFKHGTSKMLSEPSVVLNIIIDNNILIFKLINSKPAENNGKQPGTNRGLGLKNVRKRLELLYPARHELQIIENNSEYSVFLTIELNELRAGGRKIPSLKQEPIYDELS